MFAILRIVPRKNHNPVKAPFVSMKGSCRDKASFEGRAKDMQA
jgi:hypothetical protein